MKKKILVIGQTPPPYGGQAVMIQAMLDLQYEGIELFHVRMSFSKEMDDMGRLQLGKLIHAVEIVVKAIYFRLFKSADVLYFPPSGPDLMPVLRDIAILFPIRWIFRKTVFHFHAAGLSEIYPRLPIFTRPFFRVAYWAPDIAIQLSKFNPDDGAFLHSKKKFYIPNGIADESFGVLGNRNCGSNGLNILFVGLLTETKGIISLIEAISILKQRNPDIRLTVLGKFSSASFEARLRQLVKNRLLESNVEFMGVKTGEEKARRYACADIFCFPTFFESESFSLVTAEAMSYALPVVVTRWRGLQSLVDEGESGYLVEPRDVVGIAHYLQILIDSPALRHSMGKRGRELFLEKFTMERFRKSMFHCFADV